MCPKVAFWTCALLLLPAWVRGETVVTLESGKQYELGKRIGKGATGRVFRAREIETGRNVAVKLFDELKHYEEEAVSPYWGIKNPAATEMVLSRHDHGLVLKIEQPKDDTYRNFSAATVMELTDGSLHTIRARFQLGNDDGKPVETDAESFSQRALALGKTAHRLFRFWTGLAAEGIVHGDLKPENVGYLDGPLRLKILDAGSVFRGPLGQRTTREIWTTDGFEAPEIADYRIEALHGRHTVNSYADLYSIANTLLDLACGKCDPQQFRTLIARWSLALPRDERMQRALAALWFTADLVEAGRKERPSDRHEALKAGPFREMITFTPKEKIIKGEYEPFLDLAPRLHATFERVREIYAPKVWERTDKEAKWMRRYADAKAALVSFCGGIWDKIRRKK